MANFDFDDDLTLKYLWGLRLVLFTGVSDFCSVFLCKHEFVNGLCVLSFFPVVLMHKHFDAPVSWVLCPPA